VAVGERAFGAAETLLSERLGSLLAELPRRMRSPPCTRESRRRYPARRPPADPRPHRHGEVGVA
jgi:hypothetical protein